MSDIRDASSGPLLRDDVQPAQDAVSSEDTASLGHTASSESAVSLEASPGTPDAMVFNVQRFSTEDGPGIRTTIFFKGCPMWCPWCHNPEGLLAKPQLVWHDTRCMGARKCVSVCSKHALTPTARGMLIDHELCDACGECAALCPSTALELIGRRRSVDSLVTESLRDRDFYETSGGGVTLSGGEPCLQPRAAIAILSELRAQGVHVALDSCGAVAPRVFAEVAAHADLLLFDLKQMDPALHLEQTGRELDVVLANAEEAARLAIPIWVRTPIIPGHTDSDDNISAISRFIAEHLPATERYDLLAFNNLCSAKYARLGWAFLPPGTPLVSAERMEALADVARRQGLANVVWSGMTATGDGPC